MVEFPPITVDGIPHSVVYFEQDGEDIYQFRAQADLVTVPDQEILKVRYVLYKTIMLKIPLIVFAGKSSRKQASQISTFAA